MAGITGDEGDKGGQGGAGDGGAGGDTGVKIPDLPENWQQGLPEELRDDKSIGAYKTVPDLAKAMINARKMVGADKVVVPGKSATDEDWGAFFNRIGKPAEMPDYEKEIKLPEGVKFREGFLEGLQETAFKSNMLPSQVNKMIDWYVENEKSFLADQTKIAESNFQNEDLALKNEWGGAYQANVAKAKNAFKHIAERVDGAGDWVENRGMNEDPMLLRIFAEIGKLSSEDSIIGGDDGRAKAQTPDEIKKEINTIMANPEHPYNQKLHANHEMEVRLMNKRFAQVYT